MSESTITPVVQTEVTKQEDEQVFWVEVRGAETTTMEYGSLVFTPREAVIKLGRVDYALWAPTSVRVSGPNLLKSGQDGQMTGSRGYWDSFRKRLTADTPDWLRAKVEMLVLVSNQEEEDR